MKNTKQEAKFFSIAEKFCFEFDDDGKYSFDRYDLELGEIIEKFQAEIIENCTNLLKPERDYYLNRLKTRLHPIGLEYFFIEKRDGQFVENENGTLTVAKGQEFEHEQLIPFGIRIENKGAFYTIEPEEAKQYFAMLKHYKRILLRLITEITTELNEPEPESLPDHSALFAALNKYITGISSTEFTNIIETHSITPGTQRAIWKEKPVDAHRFATFIGIKVSLWNKCFTGVKDKKGNLRPLKDSDKEKKEWKGAPINEILKAHLNK